KSVHFEQHYAKVVCKDFHYDLHCPGYLVKQNKLKEGLEIEFETEYNDQYKKEQITMIKKPLELLFKLGLKIDELTSTDYNKFCELCRQYVRNKRFKDHISTSKLRNLYSEILKINLKPEDEKVKSLSMFRPKLAYYSGRDSGTSFFMNELENMISEIKNPKQVENFKDFFEAIVCYKKDIGGKK
ncbi:MAG: type III-A CRISPR-associated protein Csm2, partial [Bacteroidetes bacterium]|nr:type III-A CRISPR-associated protein Csm2 [Bacteroidota bacterium]